MTPISAPGRVIHLADGPHVVKFTTNRLIAAEQHCGTLAGVESLIVKTPVSAARYLLWLGTGSEGTEDAMGDLMDGCSVVALIGDIRAAIDDAVGGPADPEADPTSPPTGSTPGMTS